MGVLFSSTDDRPDSSPTPTVSHSPKSSPDSPNPSMSSAHDTPNTLQPQPQQLPQQLDSSIDKTQPQEEKKLVNDTSITFESQTLNPDSSIDNKVDESQTEEEKKNDNDVAGEGGEEEEEEEGECGFCLFMKGGGCKESFIAWEKCVEEAEKNKEDVVEKCFEATSALKKCMDAHSDYYEPILRAEKAAEEEAVKQLEKEKAAEGSDHQKVETDDSKGDQNAAAN